MKRDPLKLILALAALLLSACTSAPTPQNLPPAESSVQETQDDVYFPSSPLTTSTPESLPSNESIVQETPDQTNFLYYPLETVTGIESIDDVLGAIASADAQQVRDLFGYTSTTCMTVNALGGPPPCRAGEAEGTPVEVLPFLGPEGSFLRRDEAQNFPGLDAVGLFAIYEVSESAYSEENFPAGEYGIMLVAAGSEPGYVLQVKDGQIIRIDYIFDFSAVNDRLQRDASNFILAPRQ